MAVKTWVGRFTIVDGEPREEGPFLRSFPRQRPDEEEDELYVLVEPASEGSREYSGQLADAVGRLFRQDPLSITGAVLRALRAAHQQLAEWNQRSLREHRVGAGVSCVAVRDRTAYLAQVGPATAYHLSDGRVTRIVPEGAATEPLGQSAQLQPMFSRFELAEGDLLLVASPAVDRLLGQETLRSILLRGGDDALVELFRIARDEHQFSLVLLACVEEEAMPAPSVAPAAPAGAPGEPAPPEEAAAEELAPEEPALEEAPAAGGPALEPAAAGEPPPGLSEPKVRLKGSEAGVTYRRATGVARRLPTISPFVIFGAIILVAAGLIAFFVIPPALEESRDDQFDSLIADARVNLDAALTSEDPAQQREALRLAEQKLEEAADIREDDPELLDLLAQVADARTALNAVVELPELQLIADVSEQVPGPVSSRDLALGGGGAYFLDQSQGRVIAIALVAGSAEPFVLFETSDLIETEIADAPAHITWAEDLLSLLIMDESRRLIAVTPPREPGRLLTVRDIGALGSVDGIAYRDSALYILDRNGDQVWRYLPSEGGFDSEREPLVSSADLEQALEISIGPDALYLVVGDDQILRVRDGAAEPLSLAGIDQALVSPASLVPLDSGALLIADRGNDRIVVLAPDGSFLQQWRSPTFTDLRSIAVDQPNGLLYIVEGGALFRTPLPPIE